jgi:hypothetical protein
MARSYSYTLGHPSVFDRNCQHKIDQGFTVMRPDRPRHCRESPDTDDDPGTETDRPAVHPDRPEANAGSGPAPAPNQNIENNPMQSSPAVAGMCPTGAKTF